MRKINDTVLLEMMKDVNAGKITQRDVAVHFGVSAAAVCKRLKRLEAIKPPESLNKLTRSKQKFCLEIASGKNQKDAALSSHSCTTVNSAKSLGSALVRDPDVKLAISDLLAQEGMPRRYRIGKLKKLVDSDDGYLSHKALDTSFKIDGLYKDGTTVNIGMTIIHDIKLLDEEEKSKILKSVDQNIEDKIKNNEVIDIPKRN